jgi:hypothetical protein
MLCNEEFDTLCLSPDVMVKYRRKGWTENVARIGEKRNIWET